MFLVHELRPTCLYTSSRVITRTHTVARVHTNEIFHNGGLAGARVQNGSLITTATAINSGMRGRQQKCQQPGRTSIYGVSKLISGSTVIDAINDADVVLSYVISFLISSKRDKSCWCNYTCNAHTL